MKRITSLKRDSPNTILGLERFTFLFSVFKRWVIQDSLFLADFVVLAMRHHHSRQSFESSGSFGMFHKSAFDAFFDFFLTLVAFLAGRMRWQV